MCVSLGWLSTGSLTHPLAQNPPIHLIAESILGFGVEDSQKRRSNNQQAQYSLIQACLRYFPEATTQNCTRIGSACLPDWIRQKITMVVLARFHCWIWFR